jgi:hypothetical protein
VLALNSLLLTAEVALTSAVMAVVVAHGILRPLLEARGVSPWRWRDTLGSTPLVTIGSAIVSASATQVVLSAAWQSRVLCLALLAAGALTLRLGLLAVRKLT